MTTNEEIREVLNDWWVLLGRRRADIERITIHGPQNIRDAALVQISLELICGELSLMQSEYETERISRN